MSPRTASRLFASGCKRVCCSPLVPSGLTPAKRVLDLKKNRKNPNNKKYRDNSLEPVLSTAMFAPVPAPRVSEQLRGRPRALLSVPGLLLPPPADPQPVPPRRDPPVSPRARSRPRPRLPPHPRRCPEPDSIPRPATRPTIPPPRPTRRGAGSLPGAGIREARAGPQPPLLLQRNFAGGGGGTGAAAAAGPAGPAPGPGCARGAGPRARATAAAGGSGKGRAGPGCRVGRGPVGNGPAL